MLRPVGGMRPVGGQEKVQEAKEAKEAKKSTVSTPVEGRCHHLRRIGRLAQAADTLVGARSSRVNASGGKAAFVRPVVALRALRPFVAVGLSVVIDFVAMGAVLVLLVAKAARVAEVQNLALDLTVSPERRVRRVAVGALVVVQARARVARLLLVRRVGDRGGRRGRRTVRAEHARVRGRRRDGCVRASQRAVRVHEGGAAVHVQGKGTRRVMMMRHAHGRSRSHATHTVHALMMMVHLKVGMRVGGNERGRREGRVLLGVRLDRASKAILSRHHSLSGNIGVGGRERVGCEAFVVTVRDGDGVRIRSANTSIHTATHAASTIELGRSTIGDA